MLGFIAGLPGLISGLFGTINGITAAIANERIALISAKTDEERIHSQERLSALQARQSVLIAEAGFSRLNMIVRALLALGPASFLLKVFLWDKVIGSFVGCSGTTARGTCQTFLTDPLDVNLWSVITAVVAFYFLYELGTNAARIIKR